MVIPTVNNWIERLFSVSPDGGNGTLEANLSIVAIFIFGILGFLYCIRKSNRQEGYETIKKLFSIN